MTRALLVAAVLAGTPGPQAEAAACGTAIKLGPKRYILERFDVGCGYSRTWSKRLYRTKGRRAPAGFNCKSFSNWTADGQCLKKGNPRVGFSWRRATD